MGKIQSVITPVLPPYFQLTPRSDHSPSHSIVGLPVTSRLGPQHKHNGSWSQFRDVRYMIQASVTDTSSPRHMQSMSADIRSIHMSRLPSEVTQDELLTFIQRVGPFSSVEVQICKDQSLSAIVRFNSAAQATLAVQVLHGHWWRDRRLIVQHIRPLTESVGSEGSSSSKGSDSDSSRGQTSSDSSDSRSGPLVVNGAMGPGYHKRRKRDDDSASLEDGSGAEEDCCCDH